MACGLSARLWYLVLLSIAAVLIPGCDNTNIAFCSGSDEFCSDFFDNTFGDDDEPDPPADDATAKALAIARSTPTAVATAIARQTMPGLTNADPDLVGLWLTASTLGIRIDADHVAVTEFLDQHRAWLADTQTPAESAVLIAGLSLFAEFAKRKDPALAQAAAAQVTDSAAASRPDADRDLSDTAARIVADHDQEHCCGAPALAAASVVLCPMARADDGGQATQTACANAKQWLADHTSATR